MAPTHAWRRGAKEPAIVHENSRRLMVLFRGEISWSLSRAPTSLLSSSRRSFKSCHLPVRLPEADEGMVEEGRSPQKRLLPTSPFRSFGLPCLKAIPAQPFNLAFVEFTQSSGKMDG